LSDLPTFSLAEVQRDALDRSAAMDAPDSHHVISASDSQL